MKFTSRARADALCRVRLLKPGSLETLFSLSYCSREIGRTGANFLLLSPEFTPPRS